jgi:competence protein ComEC
LNPRDATLWAAFALVGGAAFDVAEAPSLVCLAAALVALRVLGGFRYRDLAGIALLFAIGAVRAHVARDRAAALYVDAADALRGPTRCVGSALVVGSTVVRGGSARVEVEWESAECGDAPMKRFSSFLSGVPEDLTRGDRIAVAANLAPTYLFRNEGTGDGLSMIVHTGAASTGGVEDVRVIEPGSGLLHAIDVVRNAVRKRIVATYHPDAEPLGRALVLGETDLAPDDDAAFRNSGLSHLLAVSGTHIVVAILGLVRIVRALLVRIPAIAERTHVDRWIAHGAAPLA